MALVPQYDPTLDRQNMAIQASLLQNLGAQIRKDVQTVQTNRQLKGFTEGLQNVNPDSDQFGQQIVGLMGQYPMALQTPLAQSAVSQLGAQHRYWQQEQTRAAMPYAVQGGVVIDKSTGAYEALPPKPEKPMQIGRNTVAVRNPDGTVQTVEEFGLPMPTITDPITLEEERQKNRIELEQTRQQGRTSTNPQVKALNTQLNGAMSLYMKKQAEAAKLQSLWEQTTVDGPEKWKVGMEANAARAQADQYKKMIEQINSQLGPLTPSQAAQIPSIGPAVPAPEVVESDTLIPAELTEPATKKFRYVPGQGIVPR
jgi:hypothetical protein